MNDNAKKWVAALRSGEYSQTKRRLHDENGFCCLGVLCDVYQKEVGDLDIFEDNGMFVYNKQELTLPSKVLCWVGLNKENGRFINSEEKVDCLTQKNDNGATFTEIADLIESEPEGLFRENIETTPG